MALGPLKSYSSLVRLLELSEPGRGKYLSHHVVSLLHSHVGWLVGKLPKSALDVTIASFHEHPSVFLLQVVAGKDFGCSFHVHGQPDPDSVSPWPSSRMMVRPI
ncbi:hypothetical protein Acr_06g0000040 [Actinidia rufa]|uniref:Uncharacterized protein n=1 Tax=Actinidia rufa TaxID=165716 RepID=A0A7J0ENK6_9ERIC|nr:hypothetical protein Acr_06g0000040 [Actinidia rufa]